MPPRRSEDSPKSASQNQVVFQLKITLEHVGPPIWRRLLVPSTILLPKLHDAFQAAMGWLDCHLHEFKTRENSYGVPDPDGWFPESDLIDEAKVRLNEVLQREKASMIYCYDFGDGWTHKVVLEKILKETADTPLPACVAGARSCPPEDCGGPWGYEELLEALEDPSHPRHEELLEWLGDDFDPEHFDLQAINKQLAPRKRSSKRK